MKETQTITLDDLTVLVVDDEADLRLGLQRIVRSTGAKARCASSAEDAEAMMESDPADLVITDIKMKGRSGVDLLYRIKKRRPDCEVIMITGFGSIELAVECLQAGAAHFLTKPFDNEEIISTLRRIGRAVLHRKQADSRAFHGPFIAEDARMRAVLSNVERVAETRVPVLITGESGSGKEVLAHAIHESSGCTGELVALNCAALPDALLEAELFGYRKGAFTGAERDQTGLFVRAHHGTLFLDEIPSMSPAFQAKLLRVLQDKRVRPLGAGADVDCDVRVIAATNRKLEELVARGEFREDLYYRLNVFTIFVPPLRERPDDIIPLAEYFIRRAVNECYGSDAEFPRLSPEAAEELRAWRWPGNVRELQNAVQRAVIVCRQGELKPHHVLFGSGREIVGDEATDSINYEEAKQQLLHRFQRQFLYRILEQTSGNISHAADACGLTRAAIQKMMKRLDIDRGDFTA